MTYQEALHIINGRLRFGIKAGLERISELLNALGNPQNELEFIHVAGTNGKGTACMLMASALQAAGYKTGLFTSPFVLDFRERFQIDGEMIPETELVEMIELVLPQAQRLEAQGDAITEFEFITALAFLWFQRRGCEMVVLEVGLGGRLDSTNVIAVPKMAVIMSVSLDHTTILGNTVEKIAFEKAGIIKPGGTAVLYPQQECGVLRVMEEACRKQNARLIIPETEEVEIVSASIFGTKFRVNGAELETPFAGKHQVLNALTAYVALKALGEQGMQITDADICKGFHAAKMPARMEIVSKSPLVLLDGGHNPGCAQALKSLLQDFAADKRKIAIIGMMQDKDADTAMSILAPLFDSVFTTAPHMSRAYSPLVLAEKIRPYCGHVHAAEKPRAALEAALALLGKDDMLVICGSFYLAGEIRELMPELKKNLAH